jgi:hypothetical protein
MLHVGHAFADGKHLDAELVAGDARVAEEGHLAEVARVVRAADADAVNGDDRVAVAGRGGLCDVNFPERLRLLELDGFHVGAR